MSTSTKEDTMIPIHPATAAEIKDSIGRFVDEGIARFGGVDQFAAALAAYNATQAVAR
jgi:hypothetical protein